ncbi:MAG: hypothetical protein AAFO94_11375 [Bacteroidota bacterium]
MKILFWIAAVVAILAYAIAAITLAAGLNGEAGMVLIYFLPSLTVGVLGSLVTLILRLTKSDEMTSLQRTLAVVLSIVAVAGIVFALMAD